MSHWISPRELLIPVIKFNPNHDPSNGQFASADGAGGSPADNDPITRQARWRAVAAGEPRSAEAQRAATMPKGERYQGSGPMSDAEWKGHSEYVQRTLVAHGADDTMHSPDSTHISEDMVKGVEGNYVDARRVLQNQILDDYTEKGRTVPNQRKCIMTGGPMGAGKSTVLRLNAKSPDSVAGRLGIRYDNYDEKGNGVGAPSNFVILSADDISEEMAAKHMIPKVDHLDPMEAATFVHEEASYLSKRLATTMVTQGKNVIWDFSMSKPKAVLSRMHDMRAEGYHVAGVFVDVSMDQSVKSADSRARKGHDAWLAGRSQGGRTPPHSHVLATAERSGPYRSKNAETFAQMNRAGVFDQTLLIDNEGYANRLVAATGGDGKGLEPQPPSVRSANHRELRVGDRVLHRDRTDVGTVEALPRKGGVDDRVAVYWTGAKGAWRDRHPAAHLVKIGGREVLPDAGGVRERPSPTVSLAPHAREMDYGDFGLSAVGAQRP